MLNHMAAMGLVLLISMAAVAAEPSRPDLAVTLKRVADAAIYHEAAISPDGRWVAWVQGTDADQQRMAAGSSIQVALRAHPDKRLRVSASRADRADANRATQEKAVAWSPDSAALAFLSDSEVPGQLQLYVMRLGDHSVRRLTELKGFLATPAWSPDGKSIAILFTENATRAAGPLEAVPQETGVIGREILEQRLTTVDLETGVVRQISPADLYVYEYDWSPNSGSFVATAVHGSGDNNWYIAEIYVIDRDGTAARSILKPDMQIAVPRWSPDGRRIAFIGGLMSDESVASGDVYVMSASGGAPRNLTAHGDGSTFWLKWLPTSRHILTAEAVNGASGLSDIDPDSGTSRALWRGAETITGPADFARGISASAGGMTAVIRESFSEPPTLWIGTIGKWRPFVPTPPLPPLWGKAENLHWANDEFTVQGWLVPPATVEAGRLYPMVVWAHGGPAWLNAPASTRQVDYATVLANQGYFVFLPNPRGSAGFGEKFKRANIKDMGGGDLRDILAGIRYIVSTHPVDDHRVGITGWSYGGYMAMWAITQTDRFRAAVGGAGCADLLSYYGENGIDEWLIPYFGTSVYDDPDVYARSSPINFIKRVHTPTLLIVGDSDVESPPAQSYEYWHALRTLGVKTELVVYPHEGHEFADPAHVLDRSRRIVAWFDENMPPTVSH